VDGIFSRGFATLCLFFRLKTVGNDAVDQIISLAVQFILELDAVGIRNNSYIQKKVRCSS
jgi:hypothetical protein